jgi:short subunit dehydrogenase-like uncharacterized protein
MADTSPTAVSRTYDIVVFGATGFTGQKVAEYLARNAPATVRWAIAGRSRPKLDAVKAKLVSIDDKNSRVGVLEASVDEPESLARIARETSVLATTVGSFIDYGEPVVRACIEQGTDYVDITGEQHFVELLLARYSREAAERGVRVVPSCGFESIPADLGALFTVQKLPPGQPIRLSGYMKMDAKFSSGTEQSAIKSLAPPPNPIRAPALVVPSGRTVRAARSKVARRADLGGWSAPLPTLSPSVVLRSAASLDRYGPDFSYAHHVIHPSFLIMVAALWFFGSLAFLVRFAPFRALFLRIAQQPGRGPTEEQMRRSWFKMHFDAECAGQILRTEVSGGDPGYVETSKMLAESALCLVEDRATLPARAGVLTPAAAMGEALIPRLQRAGLKFEIVGEGPR